MSKTTYMFLMLMQLNSLKSVPWVGNELVCRFGPFACWTVLLSWYTVWDLSLYSRLHVPNNRGSAPIITGRLWQPPQRASAGPLGLARSLSCLNFLLNRGYFAEEPTKKRTSRVLVKCFLTRCPALLRDRSAADLRLSRLYVVCYFPRTACNVGKPLRAVHGRQSCSHHSL